MRTGSARYAQACMRKGKERTCGMQHHRFTHRGLTAHLHQTIQHMRYTKSPTFLCFAAKPQAEFLF